MHSWSDRVRQAIEFEICYSAAASMVCSILRLMLLSVYCRQLPIVCFIAVLSLLSDLSSRNGERACSLAPING